MTNYERQEPLELTVPKGVAVIGCGGVGSWVAQMLAMAGVPELWLFDADEVSDHNLNRLPLPPQAVGQNKAAAVAEHIVKALRPDCRVTTLDVNFSPEIADPLEMADAVEWVIATTDTLKSRQMVRAWAESKVSYAEAAAEGEIGSVTNEPGDWSTPAEEQPGYASVPVWVGPCVFAAATVVAYVLHDRLPNTHRIGWDARSNRVASFVHSDDEPQEVEL